MKLSIIVPVYNLENYIAATLDSLLSIRFSADYEILVINDGSTDKSESVIRGYQQKHSQIVLYTIENQGVSNARNLGLSKAKGEYITFVDGDDTVEPDFFEKAIFELDSGGYDFVQGNYVTLDNGKVSFFQYSGKDMELCNKKAMLESYFEPNRKKIHNTVWGKVFRAEVVQGVTFDMALAVSEDQKFVFDVICSAKKIKVLKELCINYYLRDSSAIHTMDTKKYDDQLTVLAYCKERVPYPEIKVYIEWHELITLLNLYFCVTEQRNPCADEARKAILNLNLKSVKPFLDGKKLVILTLLRHARMLYDIYIRCFSRYRT